MIFGIFAQTFVSKYFILQDMKKGKKKKTKSTRKRHRFSSFPARKQAARGAWTPTVAGGACRLCVLWWKCQKMLWIPPTLETRLTLLCTRQRNELNYARKWKGEEEDFWTARIKKKKKWNTDGRSREHKKRRSGKWEERTEAQRGWESETMLSWKLAVLKSKTRM